MTNNPFRNKIILITGGSGSWGHELVHQLLEQYSPKEIRIYSRGEHRQVEMKRKFQNDKLKYIIGDVRDKNRLMQATRNVDYLFHLAALKHVPVCEENPWEAVLTNIVGAQNVIECSIENQVKKVIDVSTDKAVDPLNLYGVTKACGEKQTIAANLHSNATKFICIRGGNVIGTNGSVVPLFIQQIAQLNRLTITEKEMTRFFFKQSDAIKLVIKAAIEGVGGEVFVMKMPAVKIMDLADVIIEKLGNDKSKKKFIGIRPGEKLHETLVSKYEMMRTIDAKDYYIILPQIHLDKIASFYKNKRFEKQLSEFNSVNTSLLDKKEISSLLKEDGWFNKKRIERLAYQSELSKKDLEHYYQSEGWTK